MARLELDEAAYRAGYAAGLADDGRKCPYPASSLGSWSWSSGLIEGQAKREQGFRPPRLLDDPKP
jgi:ribosome modulation factor